MPDTAKTEVIRPRSPRRPPVGTIRRRLLDHLSTCRGYDVTIRDLYRIGWPDMPLPDTNREQQAKISPIIAALRQAGWPVAPGVARRSYRYA